MQIFKTVAVLLYNTLILELSFQIQSQPSHAKHTGKTWMGARVYILMQITLLEATMVRKQLHGLNQVTIGIFSMFMTTVKRTQHWYNQR